jgi:hypothetical protein
MATVFMVLQLPIRLLENLVVRKVSPQRQLTAVWQAVMWPDT